MALYDLTAPSSAYLEDHLIPLELGGAARDPRNLWPEPAARARIVNELERQLNHAVCTGTTSLRSARERITRVKRTLG
jgi:hypothetical protein